MTNHTCLEIQPILLQQSDITLVHENKVNPIDNHNIEDEDVILLDISINKEWIAYVTRKRREVEDASYPENNKEYSTYLTRRRFTAVGKDNSNEKIALNNQKREHITEEEHISFEITKYIKTSAVAHCRFLSISKDGKHIALSCYEPGEESFVGCFIFEVNGNKIEEKSSPKFNGRVIFLDRPETSLIYADADSFRYGGLSSPFSGVTAFDLDTENLKSSFLFPASDKLYLKNSPWLYFSKERAEDIEKVVTFTRNIRHDIVTTPYLGVCRAWSLSGNGVRLMSLWVPGLNFMAFSKDTEFTAGYDSEARSIKIYNIKGSLLAYRLKLRNSGPACTFEATHIRFCYGGKFVAMSGWEGDNVVFEIWHLESEKSIYRTSLNVGKRLINFSSAKKQLKVFEPFVQRVFNLNGEKCLMGFYMSNDNNHLKTNFIELDMGFASESSRVEWEIPTKARGIFDKNNNLLSYEYIKRSYIEIEERKLLIRFDKHTAQLWKINSDYTAGQSISAGDELLYIRAYKAPDYGISHSFEDTWKTCNSNQIKCIGDDSSGRMLVNIIKPYIGEKPYTGEEPFIEENNQNYAFDDYYTEEIFLPFYLHKVDGQEVFDGHKLESACQALHYLYSAQFYRECLNGVDDYVLEVDIHQLRQKTEKLVESCVENIGDASNYFSNVTGSRTLVLLASFEKGRDIIKLILAKNISISIFSHQKLSLSKLEKSNRKKDLIKDILSKFQSLENDHSWLKPIFSKIGINTEVQTETNDTAPKFIIKVISGDVDKKLFQSYRSSPKEKNNPEKDHFRTMAVKENVLTVLVEKSSYHLYNLIFNRILEDSKSLGPGSLSALTDALVFLQEGNSDLLRSSSKKLSFFSTNNHSYIGMSFEELRNYIASWSAHQKDLFGHVNMKPHSVPEELVTFTDSYEWKKIKHRRDANDKKSYSLFYRLMDFLKKILTQSSIEEAKAALKICVVPLPDFCSYNNNSKESAFIRIASNQRTNNIFRQGNTAFKVLLDYKWRTFAKKKFVMICFIHVLYYVSYCTGVLFSRTLYVKGPENEFDMYHPGHIISLVIMGASLSVLVVQEFRQFMNTRNKMNYLMSGYNWVDMAAFGYPLLTTFQSLLGWNYFAEFCSLATLVLWCHGILRLRAVSYFGVTLETMIQLFKNVFLTIFIMFLIIIAFTMSFIVLLSSREDNFFRDKFEGSFTSDTNTTNGTINTANISADNGFINWFKAFSKVWLFVYGVWDPITEGDAGDNTMIMVLCVLFSFVMILIFSNMIIALMANPVEEVQKVGTKAWISHFAAVISEIEILWCSEAERRSKKNNPAYIYYVAKKEAIFAHEQKLLEETKDLMDKLGIVREPKLLEETKDLMDKLGIVREPKLLEEIKDLMDKLVIVCETKTD